MCGNLFSQHLAERSQLLHAAQLGGKPRAIHAANQIHQKCFGAPTGMLVMMNITRSGPRSAGAGSTAAERGRIFWQSFSSIVNYLRCPAAEV